LRNNILTVTITSFVINIYGEKENRRDLDSTMWLKISATLKFSHYISSMDKAT
jgi:hypothetical protein